MRRITHCSKARAFGTVVVLAGLTAAVGLPPVAGGAEYVVDQRHAKADDANPGTTQMPLKTIGKGVALARAGDTVLVRAGRYREAVKLARSGAKGKPIVLKAAPGQRVVIDVTGIRSEYAVTWEAGVGHLTIDGLEVTGGTTRGIGSRGKGGHHVEIANCVVHHVGRGIVLSEQSHAVVRRCISVRNDYGVRLAGCKNSLVEENEIGFNVVDGLTVSHGSEDIRIMRNYIHDQWRERHPDGFQMYRGVTNLHMEGNLLFNCGQAIMAQEADKGVLKNNMIVCTHHTGVTLGHKSTHHYELTGNTIAFTGFRTVVFDGKGTRLRNNVLVAGGDNKLLLAATKDPWQSDYNLFWESKGARRHRREGQDTHSKSADPRFRSAPPLLRRSVFIVDQWTKGRRAKCTRAKLQLTATPVSDHFKVGDFVEVNFDGVVRTVTEAAEQYLAFKPPLKALHKHGWEVVANWKGRRDFTWDLRLADDSPGKGMGEGGRDVGSDIDIQAYRRGDFNGDGKRDLPALPAEALAE